LFSSSRDDAGILHPEAQFIYDEIARQKRTPPKMRERARELGEILRDGLTRNDRFRDALYAFGREEMLQQISLGSRKHGFALRESSWEMLGQATTDELQHLTMLALLPASESSFCEARLYVLETPEIWPILAGIEERD